MNRRTFLSTTAGLGLALSANTRGAGPARPKLRVAVIGHTGRGDFGHGLDTPWNRLDETAIVAVADPVPAGLAKAVAKMKGARGFADYRAMLSEIRPDIVLVSPRHADQHLAMALAAIEAGAKALYVEKPMCLTLAEADQLIAACARKGVVCAIAHRNRYHPVIPVVQELVRNGEIGRLLEVRGRGKEDARGGAGDLWVLGSHVLNVAVCFTGQPKTVTAIMLQGGRPVTRADLQAGPDAVGPVGGDELHARFETESGIPLFFDSVKNAGTREAGFGFQLVGTKGLVDFRLDQNPLAHVMRGNPFQPVKESRSWIPISTAGVGQPEPSPATISRVMDHTAAARDLLAALETRREPRCSARDGRLSLAMIMGIFESHRRGGAPVNFPFDSADNPLARL